MNTEREFIDSGGLLPNVINLDFGIRDSTAKTGFRVRLILTITITTSRATSHFEGKERRGRRGGKDKKDKFNIIINND